MTPGSAPAARLLKICSNLPVLPKDQATAAKDIAFVNETLSQRRREIESMLHRGVDQVTELGMLRCELDTIASAHRVLGAVWRRQFSSEMAAP